MTKKPRFLIRHVLYPCNHYVRGVPTPATLRSPFLSPRRRGKRVRGKVRALGALRGIGAETGAIRFQRGKKTPAVPANIPRTMLEMYTPTVSNDPCICSPLTARKNFEKPYLPAYWRTRRSPAWRAPMILRATGPISNSASGPVTNNPGAHCKSGPTAG